MRGSGLKTAIVLVVAVASLTLGGRTDAEATDEPTEWTTRTVPHSSISVRYPKGWVGQPRDAAPKTPAKSHVELYVEDPRNGDNLLVLSYRGKRNASGQWFPTFAEYEANVRMTNATVRGREIIAASESEVDGMPVYRDIDRWHVGDADYAIGDLQILLGKNRVIQFEATTDLDGQGVIAAIFDSIAKSGGTKPTR